MTPAPGPLSPPAGADGHTSLASEVGGSSSAAHSILMNSSVSASSGSTNVRTRSRDRLGAEERHQQSSVNAAASASAGANAPKTCSSCGRLLESNSPSNDLVGTTSTDTASMAPSPSSIAFATNPGLGGATSIEQLLANTPAVREAMQHEQQQQQQPTYHTDQDGHQICVYCFNQQQRAERFFRANARTQAVDPDGMDVEQTSPTSSLMPFRVSTTTTTTTTETIDRDGDSRMEQDITNDRTVDSQRAPTPADAATAAIASETSGSQAPSTPQRSVHPWRRPAPWASAGRGSSERTTDPVADSPYRSDGPSLRISVNNMGAGGDATPTPPISNSFVEHDVDFPPLPRSPSANGQPIAGGTAAAALPRLPLSPSRSRYGATSTSPPPLHARQSSFSRSQSVTGGLSGNNGAASNGSAPIVNFPATRGRHRASSSSSTVGAGVLGTASGAATMAATASGSGGVGIGRGRRPSATRRLSRSSSSQGPTATSFADFGEVLASGSAVVEDSIRGESIAEDPPFGPLSMTRPRLSTLEPWDIVAANEVAAAAAAAGSYATSNKTGREYARTAMTDVHRKPFTVPELLQDEASLKFLLRTDATTTTTTITKDELDHRRRALQERYLTWLDCKRPDPRADITRIRHTSQGRGCLFSGSTFRGTQKSGRMSYDVTVQIVNVDLAASHLCGYLNIRGLTDDWPELTTYFDAEIIGQRYGFVTGKWGATEADDLKHWSRFTPFRPIRNTLTRPGLRFNHMNKPFIFMRWKERFLVPDHRVRDINGASFAGFYYVCVELGEDSALPRQSLTSPASPTTSPGAPPPRTVRPLYSTSGGGGGETASEGMTAMEGVEQQDATTSADSVPPPSFFYGGDPIAATSGRMSGFYFHEHSEPYQQLTLRHVADTSTSTFELR